VTNLIPLCGVGRCINTKKPEAEALIPQAKKYKQDRDYPAHSAQGELAA
jgi:hypothetical protein